MRSGDVRIECLALNDLVHTKKALAVALRIRNKLDKFLEAMDAK